MNKYYFTLGSGHHDSRGRSLLGYYVVIEASDEMEARRAYHAKYGDKWAGTYKDPDFQRQIAEYNLQPELFEYLDLCSQIPQDKVIKMRTIAEKALDTADAEKCWEALRKVSDMLRER